MSDKPDGVGSDGELVEFMYQGRKRGIKMIIDLVVNHTSNEHPWFQDARSSPEAKHRDCHFWSKERPPDWNKGGERGVVHPGV